MRQRAAVLTLSMAGLLGAACHQRTLPEIRDDVALEGFSSCSELERYVKQQALRQMNAILDAQLEASLPHGGLLPGIRGTVAAVSAPTAGESATDFTTTNTQERGVDEADFVKNDGSRIFVLHDRTLLALAAWPPGSTRLESATPLEGEPVDMFYDGRRAVVFSRVDLRSVYERSGVEWSPTSFGEEGGAGAPEARALVPCFAPCPSSFGGVKVTVLDVRGAVPQGVAAHYLPGHYLASRRVGGAVHVVTTSALRGPRLSYRPAGKLDGSDGRAVLLAFERLREVNRSTIQSSALLDWLPQLLEGEAEGRPSLVTPACGDFYGSNAPVRLGLTTVSTLRLDAPTLGARHTHLLERASHAYASPNALYLGERHDWTSWERSERRTDHTYFHRLDFTAEGTRYTASGGVPGHVLNQFSIGEDQGLLRVATTAEGWRSGAPDRANDVFVLAARDNRLLRVGELRAIAPGERIYAARFLASRGYLVTYKKVDPLFTLDLRSPLAPRIAGELKVPGFSTYIHPLEEDQLLTIGRDTIPGGPGFDWFQELTLQVFDVKDIASPALRHKHVFGSRSSSSSAEYDHKAFNYFAARGLLAIPFSDYTPGRRAGWRSALEVFRVSIDAGIAAVGSVDHTDLQRPERYAGYPGYSAQVRRGVMMDDYVYSISFGGLKVHAVGALSGPALATVVFPELRR